EWEYVAKYGVPDKDWPYWWGPTFDHSKATAHRGEDQATPPCTTVPSPAHASPQTQQLDRARQVGVMDQLGNVWEWCQDHYEPIARRELSDAPGHPDRSRVLRGGSFFNYPDGCRASFRNHWHPSYIDVSFGFRAARACSPR
ncbi:MAG: formylglycine-generating enzyme family protein, partial [Planctomycetaceae bacterium]